MDSFALNSDSKPNRQAEKQTWPCSEQEERVASLPATSHTTDPVNCTSTTPTFFHVSLQAGSLAHPGLFYTGKIFPFLPRRSRKGRNDIEIKLYCKCLMPDTWDDDMIMCANCEEWFHFKCVDMPSKEELSKWFCSDCIY